MIKIFRRFASVFESGHWYMTKEDFLKATVGKGQRPPEKFVNLMFRLLGSDDAQELITFSQFGVYMSILQSL